MQIYAILLVAYYLSLWVGCSIMWRPIARNNLWRKAITAFGDYRAGMKHTLTVRRGFECLWIFQYCSQDTRRLHHKESEVKCFLLKGDGNRKIRTSFQQKVSEFILHLLMKQLPNESRSRIRIVLKSLF